jgi:hypothetical protein
MSSAVPPLPHRPYDISEPPTTRQPEHATATATVNAPSGPNGLSGMGKYGTWVQMGMAGIVALFAYMMLSDMLKSNRQQHADTMQRLDKSLDRVESIQNENRTRFEAVMQDARVQRDGSDRKHEDLVREVKAAAKDHTDAIGKCTDALTKMLAKMPDK